MAKTSNRVICRNEVIIEGVNVGEFESFSMQSRRETLGATAVMTLPMYGISIRPAYEAGNQQATVSSGSAKRRVRGRTASTEITVCSRVEVYCWYEGYDKIKVFDGFIEHIAEGFPTKFYLRDATFILRFGSITEAFDESATLQSIADRCVSIANSAFARERYSYNLSDDVPLLRYAPNDKRTVQAVTTPLSFENFASGRSPFEVIQYLQQYLVMYAGAYYNDTTNTYNLFIGTGVKNSTAGIIELDTRYNVIARDIVKQDSRFVDYDVKVTGLLTDGKTFTATAGLKTSKTASQKSTFDKKYGQPVRTFVHTLNTPSAIQKHADDLLKSLQGVKNKGSITLLLYPKCDVLDTVRYNDTIFDIYDAQYYVTDYSLSANERGYYQKLGVTDKVFMI